LTVATVNVPHERIVVHAVPLGMGSSLLNCLINDAWADRTWKPLAGKPKTGNRTRNSGPETIGESQLWRIKKKNAGW